MVEGGGGRTGKESGGRKRARLQAKCPKNKGFWSMELGARQGDRGGKTEITSKRKVNS